MSLLPLLVLGAGALALLFAAYLAFKVNSEDAGNERVQEIGAAIHEGAMAFLNREYKLLAIFVVIITGVLTIFIDYDVLNKIEGSESGLPSTAISYIFGAIGSALAGFIGMVIAVKSNMRTATAATKGLNPGLRVAFNSGSVMGMTVVGIGITGVTILYLVFQDAQIISGFGFGASTIALFARVGGGIYTKAADVGADLVGKVEQGIPEDDPRNPAVIADNVGDNVGDVAGMGADLFESYVGSIIAAIALATTSTVFATQAAEYDGARFLLPLLIASIGIISSIIGTFLVRTGENASMNKLLWALRTGIFAAGGLVILGTVAAVSYLDFELATDQSKWNFVWVAIVFIFLMY